MLLKLLGSCFHNYLLWSLQAWTLLATFIFLTLTLPLYMCTQVSACCPCKLSPDPSAVVPRQPVCAADNWGIPAYDYQWVRTNMIADRANIAHAAGKPIIMEESGMKTGYVSSRNSFLADMYEWANENDYAGTLVWQVYAW